MPQNQPLLSHLTELRSRLIKITLGFLLCSILTYSIYPILYQWIQEPLINIPSAAPTPLVIHTLLEGFFTRFKFAIIAGSCLNIPLVIYQLFRFIFPGLTKREKTCLILTVSISTLLTLSGVFLVYQAILPTSIQFLLTHHFVPKNVSIMLNFTTNLFYVIQILLLSSLIFQLPSILFLLMYMNILTRKTLLKSSRYVIIGIVILTAICTPPDIISQLLLAIPLILAFYGMIGCAKLLKIGQDK